MVKLTKRALLEKEIEMLEKYEPNNEKLEDLKKQLKASKKGKSSKNKGATFERVIATLFQNKYGIELKRTPQSGGFAKKTEKADDFRGDIITVDKNIELNLHIECKNQSNWSLPSWLKQAKEDCPTGKIPTVIFHKKNSSENYICLSLDDFFNLVDKDKIIKEKK